MKLSIKLESEEKLLSPVAQARLLLCQTTTSTSLKPIYTDFF